MSVFCNANHDLHSEVVHLLHFSIFADPHSSYLLLVLPLALLLLTDLVLCLLVFFLLRTAPDLDSTASYRKKLGVSSASLRALNMMPSVESNGDVRECFRVVSLLL